MAAQLAWLQGAWLGGAIETHCRTVTASGTGGADSATASGTASCIDEFLQDVGLGGGFAGYGHLPAELFANALLVALAARGWRSCDNFYENSRDADAAAARTSVAALTSTLASVRTSAAAFTSTLTSAGGGAP